MEYLVDLIQQLHDLGPEMLLGLAMIGLGYALRFIPVMPRVWIPPLCIFIPAIIYPMMADPAQLEKFPHYPTIRFTLIGFLIGVCAWMLHNKVLKKIEDKFLTGEVQPPAAPPPTPPST